MTPTSIGGEKQACISGGVNPPADIASGRIAEAFLNLYQSTASSILSSFVSPKDKTMELSSALLSSERSRQICFCFFNAGSVASSSVGVSIIQRLFPIYAV